MKSRKAMLREEKKDKRYHDNLRTIKSKFKAQPMTCLVRVFIFYFGFVTFYFIEVGTLILI